MRFQHIGVIGAGSWGTALALVAARAGRCVTLWAHDATHAAEMAAKRENVRHLPGVPLPDAIAPTAEPGRLAGADAVLLVTPAQTVRAVTGRFAGALAKTCPILLCAKGLEFETGLLMSEVLAEAAPGQTAGVLSGPTFAREVARGLPTAATLAFPDQDTAADLAESLAPPFFRPYASTDVIGVEIAGAAKNVIAIACGIAIGRGLGENARASLITRGLAEVQRLAVAKGGQAETLMGLSGVGDLALTCSSEQSRNYAFGIAIGRGTSVADATAGSRSLVEGMPTARAIPKLARSLGVEMPICAAVERVLHGGGDIGDAMHALLSRPLKAEGLEG